MTPRPPTPPEADHARSAADARHVDNLGQLVDAGRDALLVASGSGEILFANSAAQKLFGDTLTRGGQLPAPLGAVDATGPVAFADTTAHARRFERWPAPVVWDGAPAWLITLHDVTGALDIEGHLRRVNQLYAALSRTAAAVARATDAQELLDEVCRIAVGLGGFRLAWVARPDATGAAIERAAAAGANVGYLDRVHVALDPNTPEGQGAIARTLRIGLPYVCDDFSTDPLVRPWRKLAAEYGLASFAACPVRIAGRVGAVLLVYSGEPRFFSSDLLTLLTQIADELSSGLERIAAREARRRAERSLAESASRFRQMAAVSRQVFWMRDVLSGDLLYMSPAFETVFGRPIADVMASSNAWLESLHPEDRGRMEAMSRRPFEEQTGLQQYRIVRPDGRVCWIEDDVAAIREGGRIVRISGCAADITARHDAEAALRASEERLREQAMLLDAANDAIILEALDHTIEFWNRGAERILGWTRAEAVGRKSTDLHNRDPRKLDAVTRAILEKDRWIGEIEQATRSGERVLMESRWTLIRDAGGRPRGILTINTDITERKRIEAGSLRAQRLESIGTLAAGIAHDLNNILAPIVLSADMLRSQLAGGTGGELVETISVSARRGAEVVRQILSFGRGAESTRVPLNLRHVLPEIRAIIRETFPRNITCEVSAPRELWTIRADPTQIHQAFLNLCLNARDAMPRGGDIRIDAANVELDSTYAGLVADAHAGPHVRVRVTDTGGGIPETIRERVFDPFFTTKAPGRGAGLGLSTTLAIVRSHHGTISVESEINRGSTFTLLFPAEENAMGTTPPESPPCLPRGRGELILVVDDEESVRSIVKQSLEAANYRILTAVDGAEGVTLFAQQRADIALVLTDLMMPVVDGFATIKALRSIEPGVRVVAMSGAQDSIKAENFPAPSEAVGFLLKPFTLETLLAAVRAALDDEASRKG